MRAAFGAPAECTLSIGTRGKHLLNSTTRRKRSYEIREGEYELISQFMKDDQVKVRLFPDLAISLAQLGK